MPKNKQLRVVLIGASKFGLNCLNTCLSIPEVSIVGIVTAPQRFRISYRPEGVTNMLHATFDELAQTLDIPLAELSLSMHDQGLLDRVESWQPDIFLVAGWYHMIPRSWRELARAFGLHASLLPSYSGGAPLVWAMINGEMKTGITMFQMDDGVDSGPILAQAEEPILPTDTIATLYSRIEEKGQELIRISLPLLASGNEKLQAQDESQRQIMPQRCPDDGKIDWNWSASYIERFIRAQTRPYPGAFTTSGGQKLIIWSAELQNDSYTVEPGTLIKNSQAYQVVCGNGSLRILEASFLESNYSALALTRMFDSISARLGT